MNSFSLLAEHPFYEFAIILFFAALLGGIGQILKQPLIVMFIALGILLGPSVLDLVKSHENIDLLAEIGIAILLFIVGLKLDLRIIKSVGKIALMTGMGQVLFTSLVGFFIGYGLGFSTLHSFYIAVALTFSSTIIIVKLLSDKKEIDSLHGQIAVGFLIVQDIVVILVMIVLSSLRQSESATLWGSIGRTVLSGSLLLGSTLLMMRWIIPTLSAFLAKSQELLTLFAVAWAVSLAAVGQMIGFSGEVGAFLAGVSLASSPFKEVIGSRLISLRDFLLLFFFVNLGANLNLADISALVGPALIFSVFVLIGNPLIVLVIMGLMGYRKRTSFLAGLTVAQISEFSLIFAGMGLAIGHLTEPIVGLISLVGLITIGLSTYMILYSQQIYAFMAPALSLVERKIPYREMELQSDNERGYDIIIFGYGRFGSRMAEMLDEHPDINYIVVDFDPVVVKQGQLQGRHMIYGDIEDPDILNQMPYESARYILSTVSNAQDASLFVAELRRREYTGKIFVTAIYEKDTEYLQLCGADEVLLPHKMAATNFFNSYLKPMIKAEQS